MKTIQTARLLKLALVVDAAASGAIGIVQLAVPGMLGDALQLPLPLLGETGIFLVGYALMLLALASLRTAWTLAIRVIIFGNIGWALACLALAATGILAQSGLGTAYLAFQALAVLLFAGLEYAGLRASQAATAAQALRFQ